MISNINNIIARQILDSRGNPTIEVDIILESGAFGRSSVPSGSSIGSKEAFELRDNNPKIYLGKGVLKAINNIDNIIKKNIIGLDALDQRLIDQKLIDIDGTDNKKKLGANATLAISLACAKASASHLKKPLYRYLMNSKEYFMPVPMVNIINGGMHANNNIKIQEFMIVPVKFNKFSKAIQCCAEIYHNLKNILKKNNYEIYGIGDEGGYVPNINSNEKAIEIIIQAINKSSYKAGEDVFIALDLASNEFYKDNMYNIEKDKNLNTTEYIQYINKLVSKYPIISIEDPINENDYESWKILTKNLGKKIQIVGDDLFATNNKFLKIGIKNKLGNSIIIKPNQIGTLSETFETMAMAAEAGYTCIISHRSGETSDTTIADLAVATGSGQIKTGATCRSERTSKYNQLLRIEEELNKNAIYPGIKAFNFNS